MGRNPEEFNYIHYSEQSGHGTRGAANKALNLARQKGIPVSKGELFHINKRKMTRPPERPKPKEGK